MTQYIFICANQLRSG